MLFSAKIEILPFSIFQGIPGRLFDADKERNCFWFSWIGISFECFQFIYSTAKGFYLKDSRKKFSLLHSFAMRELLFYSSTSSISFWVKNFLSVLEFLKLLVKSCGLKDFHFQLFKLNFVVIYRKTIIFSSFDEFLCLKFWFRKSE